jgi:hypothetical protein
MGLGGFMGKALKDSKTRKLVNTLTPDEARQVLSINPQLGMEELGVGGGYLVAPHLNERLPGKMMLPMALSEIITNRAVARELRRKAAM